MNDRRAGPARETGHDGAGLGPVPRCAIALGGALFVFHLLVNRQYGFHGDELYFIVCGERPAWGYVDHPPFVPMVARLATALFGVNLFALRFFPALALGIGCALTGWLARRLGAGRFGECLASFTFMAAPMFLRFGSILNIPCFEILFWLIVVHVLVTLCHTDNPRWWLLIGAVCGVALLNKHTTLFLGAGLAVGMILTSRRHDLLTPWPWLGGAIAFLIFLPNLLWQFHHDWATLEFVRALNAGIMQDESRIVFVLMQVILMNAFGAIVLVAGLGFYFRAPAVRRYRILGWIFLTVLAILLVFNAKVYYLAPAYPMLMAGGAVLVERATQSRRARVMRVALPSAMAAMMLVFLPLSSPVGSMEWKSQYVARVFGFLTDNPTSLIFDFRYQLGRPEQLQIFRNAYDALDPEDRAQCVFLTDEYDTASEINVLGRDFGLPPAISANDTYYLWGPGDATGACVLAYGYDEDTLASHFHSVTQVGSARCPWYSDLGKRPIFLCRRPKESMEAIWPHFKAYW